MSKLKCTLPLAVCALLLGAIAAPAPQGSGYHLVKKLTLGGEGGWDYLNADPATHRVYISRATHLMVLSPDGIVLGDIPNLQGTHGAALAPELNRGYTTNGVSNSMTIFDLKTLAVVKEVKLTGADRPDGFLYDPGSGRVFSFNARSQDATAVDAKTGDVAGSVPLGGKPEAATADGKGHVWVNIEDKSQLVEFDSKALKVVHTWPLTGCEEPTGMAIDNAHRRLFSGCHSGQIMVVDYNDGKIVTTVPIGQGVDSTWFDPGTQYVFASCGDGTLTIAHEDSPDKYTVVDTLQTQRGARTMALDTGNHNIYTVSADFNPPPAPTAENPHPRPVPIPSTFTLMIYGR